jgi:hypothetical protein
MNRVPITLLFLATWLAVFGQTQFPALAGSLGIPLDLRPALIVYAALSHGLPTVLGIAVITSLGTDALSANPIGVSLVPCFVLGLVLNLRRHLLLREQGYAQMWLGLSGGIAIPLMTWGLLLMDDRPAPMGFGVLFRIVLIGFLNAATCPALFVVFDGLRDIFDYKPIPEMGFRKDREIKRGRT